jgi:hypothetical protein
LKTIPSLALTSMCFWYKVVIIQQPGHSQVILQLQVHRSTYWC